ncbi:MAG: replication restart helicase PriA [Planctomycetota bacterium]
MSPSTGLFGEDVTAEEATNAPRRGGRSGRRGSSRRSDGERQAADSGSGGNLRSARKALDEGRVVQVVPERGMDHVPGGLTYWVPQDLWTLAVGERVFVPLGRGNKPVAGFVIAVGPANDSGITSRGGAIAVNADAAAAGNSQAGRSARRSVGGHAGGDLDPRRLKPVIRRDPEGGRLTPQLIELARWMATYYCTPIGTVLSAMLPAAVKHGTGRVTQRLVRITPAGLQALETGELPDPPADGSTGAGVPIDADPEETAGTDYEVEVSSSPGSPAADDGLTPAADAESGFTDADADADAGAGAETDADATNVASAPDHRTAEAMEPVRETRKKPRRLTKLQRQVLEAAAAITEVDDERAALPETSTANRVNEADETSGEGADAELARSSSAVDLRELADAAGARSISPVTRLVELGLLIEEERLRVHAVWDQFEIEPPPRVTPTPGQQQIIDAIGSAVRAGGFGVDAIYGVTGSGKTEIYLCLIEQVVRAGLRAVMLVPEIALTPQTAERFRARFGDQVAILHSGLTAAQRHQQWSRVRDGEARVIVGARSAVFAPIRDGELGLIVVDEEHDGSYKQDQAPRYHARDVAIRRAQLAGVRVVLGSATPALETFVNARQKPQWRWFELRERVPGATLPQVRIVNLMDEWRKAPREDRRVHLLGPTLEGAIERTLAANGQVMLLLNRRGYANYIACPDPGCGFVLSCNHCDAAMVYHREKSLPRGGFLRCHHCEAEQMLPDMCPQCQRKKIMTFGLGTQRLEEELERKFDGLLVRGSSLFRMDSDTMQSGRHYHEALAAFRRGEIRVLLGTQMIAKGLDFPNVRLVGVINADTAISLPDFRAAERTFQLVSQVSGRSGRGVDAGLVVVQTFQPDLLAIQAAAHHDYIGFANRELRDRYPAGLPPLGRMARIVVRDPEVEKCAARANEIAHRLRVLAGIVPDSPPPALALDGLLQLGVATGAASPEVATSGPLDVKARSPNDRMFNPHDRAPGASSSTQSAASSGTRPPNGASSSEESRPPVLPQYNIGRDGVRVRGPAPCPLSRLHDHFRYGIEIFAPKAGPILSLLTTIRREGLAVSDAATAIDMDPVSLL